MDKKLIRTISVPSDIYDNSIVIYTIINWKEYSAVTKYDPNTITEDKLLEMYNRFAKWTMITINNWKKWQENTKN